MAKVSRIIHGPFAMTARLIARHDSFCFVTQQLWVIAPSVKRLSRRGDDRPWLNPEWAGPTSDAQNPVHIISANQQTILDESRMPERQDNGGFHTRHCVTWNVAAL